MWLMAALCRIRETLPQEILEAIHAPPKPAYPILEPNDLAQFDAFMFGIPTRYGNFPAQWKVRRSSSTHPFIFFPRCTS